MVRKAFAEQQPTEHRQLVSALAESCAWCDQPTNRPAVAALLSARGSVNVSAASLAPSLVGPFDFGHGRRESIPDFHIFHRGGANCPDPRKAEALQNELQTAGLIPAAAAADPNLPRRLFRDDLYRSFALSPTHHVNAASSHLSGVAS
jgi:ABC-type nitrate/sulfonate/bicarbonate transport system substrate-binding protein